jgi:Tol biopolymer transport system component
METEMKRIFFFAPLALLSLAPGCGGGGTPGTNPTPTPTPTPGPALKGRIAFMGSTGFFTRIYSVKPDGTGLTALTPQNSSRQPDWSPDGTKIAFVNSQPSDDEVFIMNADGTGGAKLTDALLTDANPAFSPDGTMIAFASQRSASSGSTGGDFEIYLMNVNGTVLGRLTSNRVDEFSPSWSPDGSKIAVITDGGVSTITVSNNTLTPIVTAAGQYRRVRWSPDGTRIAFTRDNKLFSVNPAGGDLKDITPAGTPTPREEFSWSHDSKNLVLGAGSELYTLNADGTGAKKIPLGNVSAGDPCWSKNTP